MDLPNLFSKPTTQSAQELVLSLLLSGSQVQALLLRLSTTGVQVRVASKKLAYTTLEDCVAKADECLLQLGKEAESANEVIFGVPSSWVQMGELTDLKKPVIKKITQDLSLEPLGFVDVAEIVVQQEVAKNSLYSGLVIFLDDKDITVTFVNQGSFVTTEKVGRSADFGSDLHELIARLKSIAEHRSVYLPSQVLLASFDLTEGELQEFQQIAYADALGTNKSFLQPPIIGVLATEELVDQVAREAGRAIALQKNMPEVAFAASVNTKTDATQQNPEKIAQNSQEMGFADALSVDDAIAEHAVSGALSPPTAFGIPITSHDFIEKEVQKEEQKTAATAQNPVASAAKISPKHTKLFVALGFFLGLIMLAVGGFFVVPSLAEVYITIEPKKVLLSQETEVTIDPNLAETNPETRTIAAQKITTEGTVTNTLQTTGVQVVGEKAQGEVTLYNKTFGVKNFPKGTVLKSNNLEFELDADVTVASASSLPGTTKHGEAKAKIVARQIGAEGNLPKETELTVLPYDTSTYNAFVVSGLIDGASREVRVIAQKDIAELLADSKKELLEQLNAELAADAPEGSYVIPSNTIASQKTQYSGKVEDQADSLTLELTLSIEAVTYSGAQLKPLAQAILQEDIPEGYALEDKDPEILFDVPENTASDSAARALTISMSAYARPNLEVATLVQLVQGKTFEQAQTELGGLTTIKNSTFTVEPAFLTQFVRTMPTQTEKLHIELLE